MIDYESAWGEHIANVVKNMCRIANEKNDVVRAIFASAASHEIFVVPGDDPKVVLDEAMAGLARAIETAQAKARTQKKVAAYAMKKLETLDFENLSDVMGWLEETKTDGLEIEEMRSVVAKFRKKGFKPIADTAEAHARIAIAQCLNEWFHGDATPVFKLLAANWRERFQ